MNITLWIIISILILLVVFGILAIIGLKMQGKKKRPVDYQTWFTMGIIWTGIGIPLKNYALSIMGIVFMIVSIVHKKEWKKNHKANKWEKLSSKEQKFKLWILLTLGILMFIGLVVLFFFTKK